jgi:hypothetical protein
MVSSWQAWLLGRFGRGQERFGLVMTQVREAQPYDDAKADRERLLRKSRRNCNGSRCNRSGSRDYNGRGKKSIEPGLAAGAPMGLQKECRGDSVR